MNYLHTQAMTLDSESTSSFLLTNPCFSKPSPRNSTCGTTKSKYFPSKPKSVLKTQLWFTRKTRLKASFTAKETTFILGTHSALSPTARTIKIKFTSRTKASTRSVILHLWLWPEDRKNLSIALSEIRSSLSPCWSFKDSSKEAVTWILPTTKRWLSNSWRLS